MQCPYRRLSGVTATTVAGCKITAEGKIEAPHLKELRPNCFNIRGCRGGGGGGSVIYFRKKYFRCHRPNL